MGVGTNSRTSRGFGLIELVIVIAIVAILAAIALPSFNTSIRSNRVGTQTNDLLSAFNYARNEAITRSRGVSICAADPEVDPLVCGGDAAWNLGWMVFVDTAPGSSVPVVDEVLRTWVANPNNSMIPADGNAFVRFNSRGEAFANPAPPVQFALRPESNCSNDQERTIVITQLGRSSSTRVPCA